MTGPHRPPSRPEACTVSDPSRARQITIAITSLKRTHSGEKAASVDEGRPLLVGRLAGTPYPRTHPKSTIGPHRPAVKGVFPLRSREASSGAAHIGAAPRAASPPERTPNRTRLGNPRGREPLDSAWRRRDSGQMGARCEALPMGRVAPSAATRRPAAFAPADLRMRLVAASARGECHQRGHASRPLSACLGRASRRHRPMVEPWACAVAPHIRDHLTRRCPGQGDLDPGFCEQLRPEAAAHPRRRRTRWM